MNTYAYTLVITKEYQRPSVQTGTVTCEGFYKAAQMALDTESMPWDEKRATRELVALVRVHP